MLKGSNEESEHMMLLLQELAALKKGDVSGTGGLKRRTEIRQEIKQVAAKHTQHSSEKSAES